MSGNYSSCCCYYSPYYLAIVSLLMLAWPWHAFLTSSDGMSPYGLWPLWRGLAASSFTFGPRFPLYTFLQMCGSVWPGLEMCGWQQQKQGWWQWTLVSQRSSLVSPSCTLSRHLSWIWLPPSVHSHAFVHGPHHSGSCIFFLPSCIYISCLPSHAFIFTLAFYVYFSLYLSS